MPTFRITRLVAFLALGIAASSVVAKEMEETLFLFQNRKVTVLVPDGLGVATDKDDRGIMTLRVADPKGKIQLRITFLPDGDNRFGTPRGQKELMNELFRDYVDSSVEKSMHFEELKPTFGAGAYCVFTDASLVGKERLPAGEFLHSTNGVKVWSGVAAVFTLFSNDTTSSEYRAVMTMLRTSVEEKTPPLL